MTPPDLAPETASSAFEPRRAWLIALAVFVVVALTLCYPMLGGQLIVGPESDQYVAGYSFRAFAADYWRSHHAIPLWNPFIFGGMPFVGGMHGDVFYPTAWLRWILPTGTAMNLGFALHLVLAGAAMFAFLRGLKVSWAAALTGGVCYQLSGIVASLVYPGHDGKLFVSALAPLLFLALLRAFRYRSVAAFGAAALVIGLSLHGHPQMSYYLLVAGGLWGLFLLFFDLEAPQGNRRWLLMAGGVGAVVLGFGLYAIQAMPFAAYIPYSARASVGWEYATSYALPPAELWGLVFPQMNGITGNYAGTNFIKHHTEHLGALVLLLALVGLGGEQHRRERIALGVIAALFFLVALGAATPFYRLWYEVMPRMKQVRAAGMAFYLVALVVAVYAGLGAERLLAGRASARRLLLGGSLLAVIGLLGAVGGLDGLSQSLAAPERAALALQNTEEVRTGGVRLLLVVLLGGGVLLAIQGGKLRGIQAAALLLLAVWADLWSIDRRFFFFGGTPAQLFAEDSLTRKLKQTPLPYRVWDPRGGLQVLAVYPGSWVMGLGVPQLLGYHGNELRAFDELWGGKNQWRNQTNLGLLELYAVRYVVLNQPQNLPGFHQVGEPAMTTPGSRGTLYEADSLPAWVRLMAGAVKAPEAQTAEIAADPQFPITRVALYADSEPVTPDSLGAVPAPPTATAQLVSWEPGRMRIAIEGRDERTLYLVIGENWYKDWRATLDGAAVPVLRAQHSLLSLAVPPGGREVALEVVSPEYRRGKLVSLFALAGVIGVLLAPRLLARRARRRSGEAGAADG